MKSIEYLHRKISKTSLDSNKVSLMIKKQTKIMVIHHGSCTRSYKQIGFNKRNNLRRISNQRICMVISGAVETARTFQLSRNCAPNFGSRSKNSSHQCTFQIDDRVSGSRALIKIGRRASLPANRREVLVQN